MNHFPRSLIGAAIASILAAPTVSWSQSADATLRGTAPANADVTAKNVNTGVTRRAKASAEGNYTIAGMPPGTYRVDAGPGTEQVVTLTVASTATLDLAPSTGEVVEAPMQEVTVTGRRLAEVRTSEVGSTVSQQQIETVPQITRNFLEFADAVPGIVFEVDGSGHTSLRGGAQNENGVNLFIDGVGQKGYVRSGLSGQTNDTQGNPFPQLAIGEYKVITSNYKAEYDQISSAAITALTRSGTNKFEGQAFGTYSADNFRARTPGERASDTKTDSEVKEYGIAFGGPIIEDKLHFFLTYEAKRYQTPVTVGLENIPAPPVLANVPAEATDQLGPASITFHEDLFFGKLDWSFSDNDTFTVSAKIRKETSENDGLNNGTAPSAGKNVDNDDNRYEANWKHNGQGWLNELQATYEDAFYNPTVGDTSQNGSVFTFLNGNQDLNMIRINGADPRAGQNKGQKGWGLQETLTFTDITWMGNHTVKAGVKYKQVDLAAADSLPGRPVFYYDVSASGAATTPWKSTIALPFTEFSSEATSADKQFGIFLQDDWELNDHLTLNIGARWDYEKNPSYLDFKTPQFVLDSLNALVDTDPDPLQENLVPYRDTLNASSDPNVALDINDYLSNGKNRKAYTGEFQPRLGFAYDIGADQQHVIFGGAGRAYDRTLYDYLQLEQTKFALPATDVRFNTADHPCTVVGAGDAGCMAWDPAFLTDPSALASRLAGNFGEVDLINNDLKVPYSDQFSLGMRNRLGDWNTSASVARVNSYNGFVFTLGNRYRTGAFWEDRSQPWCCGLPNAGALIIGDSGIETRSTQVLLSAEKPFSPDTKWGATFAYTFTHAKQNRNIDEHYSFDQSSIKEYPFIVSNATPKHRFVATGSYAAPWGLMLAGKFTYSTVTPHTVDGSCLANGATYPNGSGCRPVTYIVGGAGFKSLDLQLTKDFQVGDLGSMYLRLDMINITNEDNLVDYFDEIGPDGTVVGGRFNPDGNITGVPRTLRMSFGVKF
jgi:outer membrane receptor protein involved in Fe transport